MSDRIVTIATTRERIDGLRRHLAHQFLGHKKDEELVRGLLDDIDQALVQPGIVGTNGGKATIEHLGNIPPNQKVRS